MSLWYNTILQPMDSFVQRPIAFQHYNLQDILAFRFAFVFHLGWGHIILVHSVKFLDDKGTAGMAVAVLFGLLGAMLFCLSHPVGMAIRPNGPRSDIHSWLFKCMYGHHRSGTVRLVKGNICCLLVYDFFRQRVGSTAPLVMVAPQKNTRPNGIRPKTGKPLADRCRNDTRILIWHQGSLTVRKGQWIGKHWLTR